MAEGIADDHSSVHIADEIEISKNTNDNFTVNHGGENEMGHGRDNSLIINIGNELDNINLKWSKYKIVKVQKHVRDVNEKAYEPLVLAIGPYHRGKNHLMPMEEYKKWFLKQLLKRRKEQDVTRYVNAMRTLKNDACSYYEDLGGLEEDEFVKMILLDGIFIVEVLRMYKTKWMVNNDPFSGLTGIHSSLRRDMLLIENQLPFFVLKELFGMTLTADEQLHECLGFLDTGLPQQMLKNGKKQINEDSLKDIHHLVGLFHTIGCPSYSEIEEKWEFIRCATELKEAGVKFNKIDESKSIFEIKFQNGVMKIPTLMIEDETETIFRNLIAYEQFFSKDGANYVSDYITFMDSLINSPKDVKLLCQRGIIDNWLGDDDVVAKMFNRLGDFVTIYEDKFYYSALFNNVNDYYSRPCNKWMAILRHKYFNTPWALISFLAAVLALLLTLAQTAVSFLDFF